MSGLKCVGRVGGGEVSANTYIVEASDTNVMAPGDVVKAAGSPTVVDGCSTITRSTLNAAHVGVISGFEFDAAPNASDAGPIRAASTKRRVIVIDDPEAIFESDQDGTISDANVGANIQCDLLYGAPSNGVSTFKLDSSETASSGNDMIVLGRVRDATGSSTKLLVKFNLHAANRA